MHLYLRWLHRSLASQFSFIFFGRSESIEKIEIFFEKNHSKRGFFLQNVQRYRVILTLLAPPVRSVLGGAGPPQGVPFVGAQKWDFLTLYGHLEW